MRILLHLIVVLFLAGCISRDQTVTISPKEAYSDGFEVVVLEQNGAVVHLKLEEAEKKIGKGASTHINVRNLEAIKSKLDKYIKKRPTDNYPFVGIKVEDTGMNSQEIRLSFHYSKATYFYTYQSNNEQIIPIESGYKDLSGSKISLYE